MNVRLLFVASCIALVTSAFTFIVRGEILQDVRLQFNLTQGQFGAIEGSVFLGMAASMLAGGWICDLLGMKRIMYLAFASHLVGVLGTMYVGTPDTPQSAYYWLLVSSFLMGCGNGFTEVAINPLVATLFPKDKTHYLNILHAWWPGGLVIGGVVVRLVHSGLDFGYGVSFPSLGWGWQACLCLILAPCLVYGAMVAVLTFPPTERVASGVSGKEMFGDILRPLFIFWAFCMILTAATELGPQKWQESVMTRATDGQVSGTLILVYTSGIMFVLRHFAGPLAHALSPVGMVLGSS
ncbi:MAG: MFS transporter, partial [Planctomycetia bacterium]